MSIRGKKSICAAVVLAAALITVPLHADDVSWITDADGLWHETANWSSDPLGPGVNDNVTIDRPGFDINVTNSQDLHTINDLLCSESLTLSGGGLS
jgi:hypothetical protein